MQTEKQKKQIIKWADWRQRLGLSVAEFDALTPFELDCEIEAYCQRIEDEQRAKSAYFDNISTLLDLHLARIAMLVNGVGKVEYKDTKFDDFILIKKPEPKQKTISKKAIDFDARTTAAAIQLLKEQGIPYGS